MIIKKLSLKNTSIANNILNTCPYILYVPDYRMFKGGKIQTWL